MANGVAPPRPGGAGGYNDDGGEGVERQPPQEKQANTITLTYAKLMAFVAALWGIVLPLLGVIYFGMKNDVDEIKTKVEVLPALATANANINGNLTVLRTTTEASLAALQQNLRVAEETLRTTRDMAVGTQANMERLLSEQRESSRKIDGLLSEQQESSRKIDDVLDRIRSLPRVPPPQRR